MNRRPLTPITEADRAAYDRDGIVCLRRMVDAEWIDHLGRWGEVAMAEPGPHAEEYGAAGAGRFFGDLDIARRHEGFRRFVHESPAAEIAGRVMGATKVNFFYDQLLVKEPGTAERTPWHQDQPYWAVSGRQVCSIWLPFDPVAEDTCVEYVAGSHLWPEFNPAHFSDHSPYEGTGLPPLPDIEAERGAAQYPAFRLGARRLSRLPGDDCPRRARECIAAPPTGAGDPLDRRRRALLPPAGRGGHPDPRPRPDPRRSHGLRRLSGCLVLRARCFVTLAIRVGEGCPGKSAIDGLR